MFFRSFAPIIELRLPRSLAGMGMGLIPISFHHRIVLDLTVDNGAFSAMLGMIVCVCEDFSFSLGLGTSASRC